MVGRGLTLLEFVDSVYVPARLGLSLGRINQLDVTCRAMEQWARRLILVGELTEGFAVGFLADYYSSGMYSPATVNTRRQNLLAIARLAYRRGYLSDDPNRWEIPRVQEVRRLPRAWTRNEVMLLLAEARRLKGKVGTHERRLWWPAFLLTCWDTGARVGSVLGAKTADLSLDQGYLILVSSKTETESLYWLSDSTLAAIAAIYCPHHPELFPWPYRRDWLWRYFRRHIVEPSGVPCPSGRRGKWLFHCLRRSRASDTARSSLEDARRLLGHTRADTTVRHYIDPTIADPRVRPASLESVDERGHGRMWYI